MLEKTVDLFKKIDETITEYDIDIIDRICKPRGNGMVTLCMLCKRKRDVICM